MSTSSPFEVYKLVLWYLIELLLEPNLLNLFHFYFIKKIALPVREILQNWKKLAEVTKNRKHS